MALKDPLNFECIKPKVADQVPVMLGPNITGTWGSETFGYTATNPTGCFYNINTNQGPQYTTNRTNAIQGFDASRSNNFYGKAQTVQPNSVSSLILIKI